MATDVSIAISAKDNYTQVIQKIEAATKTFATDISGLQGRLDKLNKTRSSLQINVTEAKNRVRELTKEMNANGDASDETKRKLQEAEEEYQAYASALREVQTQAKETERNIRNLNGTGKGGGQNAMTLGTLTKTIASSQLISQVAGAVGDSAAFYISSAKGEKAGLYTQSTVSGALAGLTSGAALGTTIAPGIGTAIGAAIGTAVGAGSGALSASTQIKEEKDSFFKDLLRDKYTEATEKFEATLGAGKTIAGSRETDLLAFERLLGGKRNAQSYLAGLVDKAAHTPFGYEDLTAMSKTLATFGYSQQEMLDMIDKVGDTGAALGMDKSGMVAVATYLGRMKSSGKTTLEYINPLIERGIPVMDYLSESLGKSKTEVYDMISKGLIPGAEAAEKIADCMGTAFKGSMGDMSRTYDGMLSTIEDYEAGLQNAMGDAYNYGRKWGKGGLNDQISWYEENADEMEELYERLGKWKAEQDNAADQILFDTYQKLLDSDWKNLSEADMYSELLAAETEAAAKYTDTTQFTEMEAAQKSLVDKLGKALAPEYEKMGYDMAQWFTKGYKSYVDPVNTAKPAVDSVKGGTWVFNDDADMWDFYSDDGTFVGTYGVDTYMNSLAYGTVPKKAFGFSYVPYDDYPAMLHQGERVLTASQNREYSRNMGGVSVVMNGVTVREDADIDRIADELYFRIRAAAANYSEVD